MFDIVYTKLHCFAKCATDSSCAIFVCIKIYLKLLVFLFYNIMCASYCSLSGHVIYYMLSVKYASVCWGINIVLWIHVFASWRDKMLTLA